MPQYGWTINSDFQHCELKETYTIPGLTNTINIKCKPTLFLLLRSPATLCYKNYNVMVKKP